MVISKRANLKKVPYGDDAWKVHEHHAVQAGSTHGHGDDVAGHSAPSAHAVAHAQLYLPTHTHTHYTLFHFIG